MRAKPARATATGIARVSVQTAWDISTPIDPARFYPKYGPLPAVTAVRGQTGSWDAPGRFRTLILSDGGSVVETIVEATPPELFVYELSDFTGLFRRLVSGGRAEWRFTPATAVGTRIRWDYTFYPRRGRGILVRTIVRFAWAPYMRSVLPAILGEVEACERRTAEVERGEAGRPR